MDKDWDGKTTVPYTTMRVVALGGHQWCQEVEVWATGEARRKQANILSYQ